MTWHMSVSGVTRQVVFVVIFDILNFSLVSIFTDLAGYVSVITLISAFLVIAVTIFASVERASLEEKYKKEQEEKAYQEGKNEKKKT